MSDLSEKNKALQKYVVGALHQGILAKGVHEVCKAIETRQAKFVVLADDCDEQNYKKIVKALCKENNIPLKQIEKGSYLGEWVGICKYDSQFNIRKAKKCSSVALKEFPAEFTEEEGNQFLTSF